MDVADFCGALKVKAKARERKLQKLKVEKREDPGKKSMKTNSEGIKKGIVQHGSVKPCVITKHPKLHTLI